MAITAKNTTTFTAAVQHDLTRAPIVTLGGKYNNGDMTWQ